MVSTCWRILVQSLPRNSLMALRIWPFCCYWNLRRTLDTRNWKSSHNFAIQDGWEAYQNRRTWNQTPACNVRDDKCILHINKKEITGKKINKSTVLYSQNMLQTKDKRHNQISALQVLTRQCFHALWLLIFRVILTACFC